MSEEAVKKQSKKVGNIKESKSQIACLLKGLATAYAITCIIFIAYALILTYTWATEEYISLVALICTVISAIVAGFDSAKGAKNKGLFWGMGAGICYAIILFIIGFVAKDGMSFDAGKITTLLISTAGGGIGGILGINIKK